MKLSKKYYFEEAKKNTILQQYFKMKEELKEVYEEIAKENNTNLVLEILDLIQASHNLLNKLEDGGTDVEEITKAWKGKMDKYKAEKYASN